MVTCPRLSSFKTKFLLSTAGVLLTSCIGVYGQKPEVASMKDAEAKELFGSSELEDSLEGGVASAGHVNVSVKRRYQKLEGFGASTAWYMDLIVGPTTEDLYEFLFPELGIDIIRFRNRFERKDRDDSNLAQEQEIFKRATQALGHPPKLMLSSWSPPAAQKQNGREKCKNELDCTLKKVDGKFVYEEYADWWIRSLSHYQSLGMAPDFVSMQNEPSFIPPDWEGCKFEPAETEQYPGYGTALRTLHSRLGELSFKPQLLGPENLGIHYDRVKNYLAELDQELLYGVAHHIYEKGQDEIWDWRDPGPSSFADEMLGVASLTEKPIFQTEFGTDEDQGIEGGFETAWLIHNSLVEEGAAAFLYWELMWPGKGLVSMKGRTPTPRDHYYSMKHFARYTDPGYQRVSTGSDAQGLLASAFISPDNKRLTVVLLNTNKGVMNAQVSVEDFSAKKNSVFRTVYRPGKSKRWEELGQLPEDASLSLPARSVATIVFDVE